MTARLARALGLDGNPLSRASDRAEAWVRLGLLAVFLAAGPVAALAAGGSVSHMGSPAEPGRFANDAALAAVMTLVAVALALRAALQLTRRFLNRRRLAAWEAAWSAIGPRWTSHRSLPRNRPLGRWLKLRPAAVTAARAGWS